MKIFRIVAALTICLALIFVGACVVGQSYKFSGRNLQLDYTGSRTVAVASHDQRPDILSGDMEPKDVGELRGGFGVPHDVDTESEKPFAEVVTIEICTALKEKGFDTNAVMTKHTEKPEEVKSNLQEVQSERHILVTIHQWMSDTYMGTSLEFDVEIAVLDENGNSMASHRINSTDEMVGVWDPKGTAQKVVSEAFQKCLEELLNNPDVVKALS